MKSDQKKTITAFLDVILCGLVEKYKLFEEICYYNLQVLPKLWHPSTLRQIPKDSNLHIHLCENHRFSRIKGNYTDVSVRGFRRTQPLESYKMVMRQWYSSRPAIHIYNVVVFDRKDSSSKTLNDGLSSSTLK
jgi:hypothetical protein